MQNTKTLSYYRWRTFGTVALFVAMFGLIIWAFDHITPHGQRENVEAQKLSFDRWQSPDALKIRGDVIVRMDDGRIIAATAPPNALNCNVGDQVELMQFDNGRLKATNRCWKPPQRKPLP